MGYTWTNLNQHVYVPTPMAPLVLIADNNNGCPCSCSAVFPIPTTVHSYTDISLIQAGHSSNKLFLCFTVFNILDKVMCR